MAVKKTERPTKAGRTKKTPSTVRVILETDLHNDCGLIAAAAWNYLDRHGIKARVLNIRYGKSDGHTIVVFISSGRLCTYDHDGCLVYNGAATWDTPPLLIGRAWVKAMGIPKKIVDAKWF